MDNEKPTYAKEVRYLMLTRKGREYLTADHVTCAQMTDGSWEVSVETKAGTVINQVILSSEVSL